MPKVSESHKEAVRQQLMDATVGCIRERGYEGTTTRAILERAGLSAGAMYTYFDSKEALMASLSDRIFDRDFDELFAGVAADDPSVEAIVGTVMALLLAEENDTSILPELRTRAIRDPAVRDALLSYDRKAVALMGFVNRRAQADGLYRDDIDPDALVEMTVLFFEALAARHQADGFATGFDVVVDTFMRTVTRGVSATPDAERRLRSAYERAQDRQRG